jgi:hypothetical protein
VNLSTPLLGRYANVLVVVVVFMASPSESGLVNSRLKILVSAHPPGYRAIKNQPSEDTLGCVPVGRQDVEIRT